MSGEEDEDAFDKARAEKRFTNFSENLNKIDEQDSHTRHYKELMRFFIS